MDKYVVRQPIKDLEDNIIGYEILFQEENGGLYNGSNDSMAADTISGFLMQNNDKIFNEKTTFMTFTPSLLFRNTPKIFQKGALVIQIEDNIMVHPLSQVMIQKYRNEGYRFAINDFQFAPRYFSMMEFVDFIKVNLTHSDSSNMGSLSNIIKMAKGFHKECIAAGVDTKEAYEMAVEIGVDYFQGTFIADTLRTKSNKMEYLEGNFFQLVVAVTKDEPDVTEIENIISRDASLTYALLKMVNSAYFALRRRTSSIRQALVTLGIGQLKQWVYLMSFRNDDMTLHSEEVLKMSFLRANFCSSLAINIKEFPISKSEAYMMGMFSTLNYLVDAPLEEILEEIPISDEIKVALTAKEGPCGTLLKLVLNYEKADWQKITKFAEQLGIQRNLIAQTYFDCVEAVNQVWTSLTSPNDKAIDEPEEKITESVQENQDLHKDLGLDDEI